MTSRDLLPLLDRWATVHHRAMTGPEDRYNTPTWEESSVTVKAYIEQRQPEEHTVGRETHVATHLLVLPVEGHELDASDEVTMNGDRYQVIGPPWVVWDPVAGVASHIEAKVRQVS